jgi:hypothetical protein
MVPATTVQIWLVYMIISCVTIWWTEKQDLSLLMLQPKIWTNWEISWEAVWLQADVDTHDLLNMNTFKTLQYNVECTHYEPWNGSATVFNKTPLQYANKYISFIYIQFLKYFCPMTINGGNHNYITIKVKILEVSIHIKIIIIIKQNIYI